MIGTMAPSKKGFFQTVGALIALGAVVLLAGAWWISSLYQSEEADNAHASAAFAAVRARFDGLQPAFEIRKGRLVVMREPAAAPSPTPPVVAHMMVWQPHERMLSRVTLPLWMSRVATEPLPLEALAGIANQGVGALMDAKRRGHELNIRLGDLERYGRTLLLDGVTDDGTHVMMWND